jgi:hypothetical protein
MVSLPKRASTQAAERTEVLKKLPCSPRAAVALTAWSSWTGILEMSKGFFERVVEGRVAKTEPASKRRIETRTIDL